MKLLNYKIFNYIKSNKNKKVIFIIIGSVLTITAGYFIYNQVKKTRRNVKNENNNNSDYQQQGRATEVVDVLNKQNINQASNSVVFLKNKIIELGDKLNSNDFKNKWGTDEYVALQYERSKYISQLNKLGWKTITRQLADGSFSNTEFVLK